MDRNAEFSKVLLRKQVVSPEQLNEAVQMSREQGLALGECLIRLDYATGEQVMQALAAFHKMKYVDLSEVRIPESVIELVPESVARENGILPFAEEGETITVIVSDPLDIETFEKLRFILNEKIDIALAPREAILEAINRYYGQIEGEVGRLDAAGIHRYGDRLHRNLGRLEPRRRGYGRDPARRSSAWSS